MDNPFAGDPFMTVTPDDGAVGVAYLQRILVRDDEDRPVGLTITIVGVGDFTIPIIPRPDA